MGSVLKFLCRIEINRNAINIQRNIRYATTDLANSNQLNIDSTNDKKTKAVEIIQNALNLHMRNALKLVNENQKLIKTSPLLIAENHEVLIQNDINSSTIMKYPHLLWTSHLKQKISILIKLDLPLRVTIVLAGLSKPTLEKMVSYQNSEDRIFVLSQFFNMSPTETCEFLYKRNFLLTRSLDTMKEILKILREFGILLEDIKRDPWILRYSQHILRDRIKMIADADVELLTPKPWMLRSPMEVIENYVKRRHDNQQILGSASLTEYLSNKLDCTEEQAKYLISKMPALTTKSLRTLSDIINFLHSKGFGAHHIYRVPKILVHSVETTKKRLEQIENAGIKIDSLYMLTKSQKQFMQIFEAMIKSKRSV